jgi:hypothetical protein
MDIEEARDPEVKRLDDPMRRPGGYGAATAAVAEARSEAHRTSR